ncbi:hypothetical protein COO60DRAFT_1633951 [Scenedesmus sp. NREL 46B-D3]|nr:hypothetical protein COO60DRAFT_1633951 [Scenedesmus sp. NREL 46B-D3]
MRQHAEAVEHMVALAAMQQHVDAATLEEMMGRLLKLSEPCRHDRSLALLCQLPAAAQLSSDAAMRLLLAAIKEEP